MSDVVVSSRPAAAVPQAAPGLTSEQARRELERVGPNVLAEAEGPHWLARFARNFTTCSRCCCGPAPALALLGGQPPLAVAIVVVIVVNAIFSFAQEYRAERAVEALRADPASARAGAPRRASAARSPPRSSCRATSCCSRRATASRPTASCWSRSSSRSTCRRSPASRGRCAATSPPARTAATGSRRPTACSPARTSWPARRRPS